MTRSRLFFNSSVIRQNLRQHGWIGIIYTLALLFALPLQMFMSNDPNAKPQTIQSLFFAGGEIQMLFAVTVPVAAGLFLFRYLQAKPSSDLWHSLPLRREHLLVSHTVSGMILLLIPIWLTAVVAALVQPLDGNMYIYSIPNVLEWCLTLSILTLFLFIFSMFVGICTGQTVLQGAVIYILLLLPVAMLQLFNEHLGMYLYGYPKWYGTISHIEIWSPLLHMIYVKTNAFSAGDLWFYSALTVLLFVLSVVLYRRRHGEKAGQAIAFTYFNPLFKAGFMLCAMLISGTYFAQLKQQELGWIIAGNLAGALIGYIAAEMIIRKTWQILTRRVPLEFAGYALLLSLLLYIPVSGITGYETRVPAADKVQAVYAGSNFSSNDAYWNRNNEAINGLDLFTEDKEYIEAVRKLQLAVTAARPEIPASYSYSDYQQLYLSYRLDNGRIMQRSYMIPLAGFEPQLRTVMESEGYKRIAYMLSRLDGEIESFRLSNYNKALSISEPKEVDELKAILKREILNMSYEDQLETRLRPSYGSFQLMGKPDATGYQLYYGYEWMPSFKELSAWLEEKGYADKIHTKPGDISSAEIMQDTYSDRLPAAERYDVARHLELARSEKHTALIKDAAAIADILENQRYYTAKTGDYLVKLVYKEGNINYVTVRAQDVTPAIKAILP
jgi:ABC-2 type transport system permease protein